MSELNKNPMAILLGAMIETSMESQQLIHELVNKYKANGVDVIPISEIEKCFQSGIDKIKDENSLTSKLLKE